jgi:transposase InsO family protein
MLVELAVVEQRYRAVLEVLEDGVPVTEVARRFGVARQTLHAWLRRYAADGGMANLADRSSRPSWCPHQMSPAVESRVLALRLDHPGWGPDRILYQLGKELKSDAMPGRSSVYRALVRNGLLSPRQRRRKRSDYRRWERGVAMQLWQMDVMGSVFLADGYEVKVVTGIDDHSRFVVCDRMVPRATAGAVCEALRYALAEHGVPEQILTDNGKVFTGRFTAGKNRTVGPSRLVLFDRICVENGITHLLTAPYSPTTTGKVERLHKTMRREFFDQHDREWQTVKEAQAALDQWVKEYNTDRPHRSLGGRTPAERFPLAGQRIDAVTDTAAADPDAANVESAVSRPAGVSRWVDQAGQIQLVKHTYRVGAPFAGRQVEVVVRGGLVEILHDGVLVATHVQRGKESGRVAQAEVRARSARKPTSGLMVTRIADASGFVSFAGVTYSAGRAWARKSVNIAIVAGSVQLSGPDGKVIRVHPIKHDPVAEMGAFAVPNGRPRRRNAAVRAQG